MNIAAVAVVNVAADARYIRKSFSDTVTTLSNHYILFYLGKKHDSFLGKYNTREVTQL